MIITSSSYIIIITTTSIIIIITITIVIIYDEEVTFLHAANSYDEITSLVLHRLPQKDSPWYDRSGWLGVKHQVIITSKSHVRM